MHQLIFPTAAAAFTHLSGEEGGSCLLVKVALAVPFLSGSTHIPKIHSKAVPQASSIPLLAARLGLSCDHSCSTYSVIGKANGDQNSYMVHHRLWSVGRIVLRILDLVMSYDLPMHVTL